MANLGRRNFLKKTSLLAGVSIVGFPQLFPASAMAKDKGTPPKPSKKSTKVVSQSKPSDKKTNNGNGNGNGKDKG